MDGWTDGVLGMDERMDGWKDGGVNRWRVRDGWMGGWMDGWIDGWVDELQSVHSLICVMRVY